MSSPSGFQLTPEVMAVYKWCLDRGWFDGSDTATICFDLHIDPDVVQAGIESLSHAHLLYESLDRTGSLVPASPQSAAASVVAPIKKQVRSLTESADALQSQIMSLSTLYLDSRQARNRREAFDVLEGVERVRTSLADAAVRCSFEVFGAHPGFFSPQALEEALRNDATLLARGIRLQSLFQHAVRVKPEMRKLLDELDERGAEVRTCQLISDRVVIIDRETAFIPNLSGPSGAVIIREPSTVNFLYRLLEQTWATAVPYSAESSAMPGYGAAVNELRLGILRMLASGDKDEYIARKLNVSLRTCRRHIAEIMEEFNVSSRFQAGVVATERSMLGDRPNPLSPADQRDPAPEVARP